MKIFEVRKCKYFFPHQIIISLWRPELSKISKIEKRILQSAIFFAGFASFVGFLGTVQHLSWFTFVMRFLHTTQFQIFFWSDWQSLTCVQHWKNEYLISNSWYIQKDFSYSRFFRNNILQVYSIISFVRGCVYNIYTN